MKLLINLLVIGCIIFKMLLGTLYHLYWYYFCHHTILTDLYLEYNIKIFLIIFIYQIDIIKAYCNSKI